MSCHACRPIRYRGRYCLHTRKGIRTLRQAFEKSKEDLICSLNEGVLEVGRFNSSERRCTMSRILTLTLTLFLLLPATNLIAIGSGQEVRDQPRPITPDEQDAMMLKAMAANVSSVAKILKDEKVDLDAELFFTSRGRKKLSPQVEKRSEEHTSELQSRLHLVCRLL